MTITAKPDRYSFVTPLFSFIFILFGFIGAAAENPGEPVSGSAPTSGKYTVGMDTGAWQNPFTVRQAPPPKVKRSRPRRPPPPPDPCASADVAGETWLDQVHDYVDRKLCQPAVWFDDFFGEDRVLEDVRPTMFISMKNSARWTERQGIDLVPDYRVRYRLPQLDKFLKRAKLYVVSQSRQPRFTSQPGKPIEPGVDPKTGARKPVVGIRADLFTWLHSLGSLDLGMKVRLPLDPFIRMRYQHTKFFDDKNLIRFTNTVLWRYVEHFSETVQVDLERKMAELTLLRSGNYVTYADGTAGLSWNTGISRLTQLTRKSAISYDFSMWGVTHPAVTAKNYRVGIKYRRNFYRSWLFYELEPEITWPKDESGRRYFTKAFMATLEVQFGR